MFKILIKSIFALITLSSVIGFTFEYHDGDIIGESEIGADPTTVIFEAATSSRFGHVGIIFKKDNDFVVYEATPPNAKVTPLKDFMMRNGGVYAVIRRSNDLSSAELAKIHAAADKIVSDKVPYNFTFIMNPNSLDCSEFVRSVFSEAGIELGKVEQVKDLNIQTFHGLFWKIANQQSPIPLDGNVVTPVSIMKTSGWNRVDGKIDNQATLSDLQLFEQWKSEQLTDVMDYVFGVSEKTLEKLAHP